MNSLLLLFVFLSQFTNPQSGSLSTKCAPKPSKLVWFDEFEGAGRPDPKKWSYDVGGNGFGNHELQFYTEDRPENARVENGMLLIETRKEAYQGKNYTSAKLWTKEKVEWKGGRFEVRAKLPAGRGTWPALWMLAAKEQMTWPDDGEIDIMEHVGFDPGVVHGTVHTQAYNHVKKTQQGGTRTVPDFSTAFHVYAVEWTPEQVDFMVDGTVYFSFDKKSYGKRYEQWPFDQPFYLILNLAVGGDWGGQKGVDDSIFPQRMEIDWVRVYQ